MLRPINERAKRDDYELLGEPVRPFTIGVDPEQLAKLRDFITQSYMPSLMNVFPNKNWVPELSESHDVLASSIRFGRNPYTAPELDVAHYTGLRLTHQPENSWRLRVLMTRYKHDGTLNKIAVRHSVDVIGNQPVQAKREVRIIRNFNDEMFDRLLTDTVDEPSRAERLAFDRPITDDTCERLQQQLQQVANRVLSVGVA